MGQGLCLSGLGRGKIGMMGKPDVEKERVPGLREQVGAGFICYRMNRGREAGLAGGDTALRYPSGCVQQAVG